MKTCRAPENQIPRRVLSIACVTALAVAFTITLPQQTHARTGAPPWVPENIRVPAGNEVFLEGHASGTQNYICLPSGAGFAWTLFGPQATLFDDDYRQITTHFLSPNPMEGGTLRPTWQHSRDTSAVWGQAIASADVRSIHPAIPWLLIRVVGAQDGPTGTGRLTAATYLQRVHTSGGVAPTTGCTGLKEVGNRMFVPYTADYVFYEAADSYEK
jgi:hypothetical protein